MTIKEWWSCNDPAKMLNCLRFRLTNRRLRLFVIAWCRVCGLDADEALQRALYASERYADELASPKELLSARMALYRIIQPHPRRDDPDCERAEPVYAAAGRQAVTLESATYRLDRLSQAAVKMQAARILRDMVNIQCLQPSVSEQGHQRFEREQGWLTNAANSVLRFFSGRPDQPAMKSEESPALKLRQTAFASDWLTSTVVAIARGTYDDRAFDRLPILADALQDAGCDSDDLLNHLRGPGPHVRGCWALDLVLGKS